MHLTPDFHAFVSLGSVPLIEHNGRVFVQSAAIPEYLAHTLGRFDEARQYVREWLFWHADGLMLPLYAWYSVRLSRRKLLLLSFAPIRRCEDR